MDAVSKINEHLDIDKLLNHYQFDVSSTDSTIIRSACKLHGGSNPTGFAINRDNGLWFCHTGNCGGGDVFTLVRHFEKLEWEETVQWLASFFGISIDGLTIVEHKPSYLKDNDKFLKAMQKRKTLELIPYFIDEEIRPVTKFRKFNETTLRTFDLGYVERVGLKRRTGEPYTLSHRLVFPILFNGIQVGLSFRRVKNTDVPKWSHQPAHINTSNLLYNYDACNGECVVVVVEGITDVWAYYEIGVTAVATFGAHITHEQYKLLLKTGADLVFSFDGDEAGQLATDKAIAMFKNKANLSVVSLKDGEDPESIEREELCGRYAHRKRM